MLKRYRLVLQDPKTFDIVHVYVFAPIEEGAMVGYGHDVNGPDGIRQWRVINCFEDLYGF